MLKLKLQNFGHLMRRAGSLEKTLMLGKTEGQEEKRATEDEMVGYHPCFNGYEFEQTLMLGDGDGQGSLACCSPWGHRVRHDLANEQQESSKERVDEKVPQEKCC